MVQPIRSVAAEVPAGRGTSRSVPPLAARLAPGFACVQKGCATMGAGAPGLWACTAVRVGRTGARRGRRGTAVRAPLGAFRPGQVLGPGSWRGRGVPYRSCQPTVCDAPPLPPLLHGPRRTIAATTTCLRRAVMFVSRFATVSAGPAQSSPWSGARPIHYGVRVMARELYVW